MSRLSDWLHHIFPWFFPPLPPPSPSPPLPTGVTATLFAAINTERAKYGLPAYHRDSHLNQAAQAWSAHMASTNELNHGNWYQRITSSGYIGTSVSENIAEGQTTPGECLSSWLSSSGHRANILGPYHDIGLGAATSTDGTWYWCADFGS